MGREVPFKKTAICDECGETGAYDFMGDYLCQDCADSAISGGDEAEQEPGGIEGVPCG